MKSLRVTSHYDVSSDVFAEVIEKFPLLEELELVLIAGAYTCTTKSGQPPTNSWVELFQSACEACSHLHNFTVRRHCASKVTLQLLSQQPNTFLNTSDARPTLPRAF